MADVINQWTSALGTIDLVGSEWIRDRACGGNHHLTRNNHGDGTASCIGTRANSSSRNHLGDTLLEEAGTTLSRSSACTRPISASNRHGRSDPQRVAEPQAARRRCLAGSVMRRWKICTWLLCAT